MEFSEFGAMGSNILLVGEGKKHHAQMNRFLVQKKHAVHSASDIEEALSLIDRKPPDLILIDLPALDPRTRNFRTRLKSTRNSDAIPVIFISQSNTHDERHQLFANGATDYICTPIIAEELHIRVTAHLALRDRRPGTPRLSAPVRDEIMAADSMTDKKLLDSQRQLRELAAHANTVIEKERKRIAQEIHDELGSLLTAMKLELALLNLEIREASHGLRQRLDSMQRLLEDAIHVTRQIASELRPVVLNLGLLAAVEWLAENFRRRSGISCQIIANGEIPLGDAQATALFRIIQESLTNIIRHADASVVVIKLTEENSTLRLEIADDGRGFDTKAIAGDSFGLLGIRERLETLSGKLRIDSRPGRGTTLRISMPIDNDTP